MSEQPFVKYCPLCGAENSCRQAFCAHCGDGDLSIVPDEPCRSVKPAPAAQPNEARVPATAVTPPANEATMHVDTERRCILELIADPDKRFTVAEGQTVGRTAKADVPLGDVPKSRWISSIHAKFSRRGEQWYVQHIGHTNFIKVDGETYTGQQEVALHDGSILVLSLTPFRVTISEAG